ncbi:hypothetical protein ACIQ6K_03775 [Streptomyces sp. NPDC096354]|uniref:hypothetical protein n=1 Tax=Streptomyces sp. NPDC096354 TaxID=3366088 RepID=UPI00382EEE9C
MRHATFSVTSPTEHAPLTDFWPSAAARRLALRGFPASPYESAATTSRRHSRSGFATPGIKLS